MQVVKKEGTTYKLHEQVSLDDLTDPSDIQGTELPEPPSEYTTRFPKHARPGDQLNFHDRANRSIRTGIIIDRAPQGVGQHGRRHLSASKNLDLQRDVEAGGYWFWVQPNDAFDEYVRVRYWNRGSRKGQARRDDGPMVIRQSTCKPFIVNDINELIDRLNNG